MSSDTERLLEIIQNLTDKVHMLSLRCDDLESRLIRLAVAKIPDPRYPFWNWMLRQGMPDETRLRLMALLSALEGRMTGTQLPGADSKLGVSHDLVYGSGAPPVDDVVASVQSVAGLGDDAQVVDMLRAVDEQGLFQTLCEYVLSALGTH